MKPIVIIENIENGHIKLTPDMLKKYIGEAYEQGFKDGEHWAKNYTYIDTPKTPYTPSITWTNDKKITCDSHD